MLIIHCQRLIFSCQAWREFLGCRLGLPIVASYGQSLSVITAEGSVTGNMGVGRRTERSSVDASLRWMARQANSPLLDLLVHAISNPLNDSALQLAALTAPTESMPGGTPRTRALAVWGLLIETINEIGPTADSRERNVLLAAFRLPRPVEVTKPWKSTLNDRFMQLTAIPGVFGDQPPSTPTPMHRAWKVALSGNLAPRLTRQLDALARNGGAWLPYVEVGQAIEATLDRERGKLRTSEDQDFTVGYRPTLPGAQPVFANLFVTTVFMEGRLVHRRITERLATATEDGVSGYTATALAGPSGNIAGLPVRALWGCEAETGVLSGPGGPHLTWLRFPTTLQRGEQHFFASEAIDENPTYERFWVNVEVDHHGIAPGRLLYGRVPVSGLTIRIRFDKAYLPEVCWWYAEQTERARRIRPPKGDSRYLLIVGDTLQHTFTEKCHPRENYGISFNWPSR